jgi:hypothetical protein
LFEINERLFLISAAHIFDHVDPSHFAIPNPSTTQSHTLGPFNLYRPDDANIDIAIVELLGRDTIAHSRESWHVLTLANIHPASSDGIFVLSGYPGERAKRRGEGIGGSLLTTYSQRLAEIPEDATPPIDPQIDLFFQYSSETVTRTGETIRAPDLRGTSGASVWECRELDNNAMWTPEQCLKVVGIQSSFLRGRYFRAKSWAPILTVLQNIDTDLAATIRAYRAETTSRKPHFSALTFWSKILDFCTVIKLWGPRRREQL